jgi:hypothetical protein
MSPLDRPIPPAGEEIHIPGGSLQPILLTAGITLALLGATAGLFYAIAGGLLTIVTLAVWIRDAIREYDELPAEHQPVTQETVHREEDRPGPTSETSGSVGAGA